MKDHPLTDTAAAATPIPRLPLPTYRIASEPMVTQPRAIGRWLEAKVSNGDFGRLNCTELKDIRTAAFLLEAWEMPAPPRRGFVAWVLGRLQCR